MEDEENIDSNIIINKHNDKHYLKEFIRVWETCPELWNTSSNAYRDKVKKNLALDKLLEIYKQIKPASTKEDVKKKLNSLRTNFRKELKKVFQSKTSGKGTDEVYTPSNWTYFELLFLKKDEQPVQQTQDLQKDTENDINTTTQDYQRYSISSMDVPSPPTFTGPKKKKKPGIDQQAFLERAVAFIEKNENEYSNSKDQDEYYLAKVWASKLYKLTSDQKILAEKAINDILYEAELGNLKKKTKIINEATLIPYGNESATLYSFDPKNSIISSGDPSQIILKPRETPSQHIALDLSSQETLYGVSSGISTTIIADVHHDAEELEKSQICIKEFIDSFNCQ